MLTYRKKFKCIDPQDMVIWGDFNSKQSQQIRIEFEMCVDDPICESKENIQKWLQNKYIVLLYN